MQTVCKINMCTGCSACISICSKSAIKFEKKIFSFNALIEKDKCINCGACYKICPQNNQLSKLKPSFWKQGWACNETIRKRAASGGIATAIAYNFIKNGGIVVSCVFEKGDFIFKKCEEQEEIFNFSGSKYVKSNPLGIFSKIKKMLNQEKKILFIGLPCQVAGLKKYISVPCQSNLYTIDLICHGTPSIDLFKKYMKEHGIDIDKSKNITFRNKHIYQVKNNGKAIISKGIEDLYTKAFLKGLIFTTNCYSCQYASINRVSDITLGDSWGSSLSQEIQKKGVSLVLCQTDKGKKLLFNTPLHLEEVDIYKAIENNKQLNAPIINNNRDKFIKLLQKKYSFDEAMFFIYPKMILKQYLKHNLIKMRLYKKVKQ